MRAKDGDVPAEMGIQGKRGQLLTVRPEPGCTVGKWGVRGHRPTRCRAGLMGKERSDGYHGPKAPKQHNPMELTRHPWVPGNCYSERTGNRSKFPPQISIRDSFVMMKTLCVCGSTILHESFNRYSLKASRCQALLSTARLGWGTQSLVLLSYAFCDQGQRRGKEVNDAGRWEVLGRKVSHEGRRSTGEEGGRRGEPEEQQGVFQAREEPMQRAVGKATGCWADPRKDLGSDSE